MFASFRRDVEPFEKRFDEKSKGNGFSLQSKFRSKIWNTFRCTNLFPFSVSDYSVARWCSCRAPPSW